MFLLLKQLLQGATVEMSLARVVTWIAAGAMVFGGVVPFIPQYLEIRRTGSEEGFSTFVCLTLIIANILRIFFWFGHRFELPLLLQSVIMTITMLAMVHLCTEVRNRNEIIASKPRSFTDLDRTYFWRWTNFESYIQFLLLFTLLVGVITYLLLKHTIYIESLGFMAVLFEAMLGAPQFYKNYSNSSTKGMSVNMVLCWTMGDIFKTVYFFIRRAPRQFWVCGILQVSLDVSILLQVLYYRRHKDAIL